MRDEELDWKLYHVLLYGKAHTTGDLGAAGYDISLVEESLCRLEKSHLIERRGDTIRPLSFHEAILLCQLENDTQGPICIENGVIRTRPGRERKP